MTFQKAEQNIQLIFQLYLHRILHQLSRYFVHVLQFGPGLTF